MIKANIRTRVITALLLVFIVMLFAAGFQLIQMNSMKQDSQRIYEHPYIVSNTVDDIKTELLETAYLSRYITLTNNGHELDSIVKLINHHDEIINNDFKILFEKYLGDKKDVDSLFAGYTAWGKLRNSFYKLKSENKPDSIRYIVKYNSHFKLDNCINNINRISVFANNKANSLITKITNNEKEAFNFSVGLLLISAMLVLSFIVYLSKSITRPIKKFVAEANTILNPIAPSTKVYHDEELLLLTLDELKKAYKSIEQQASDIDAYNKQLADQNISLEYNVGQKTAELKKEIEVRKQAEEKIRSIAQRYDLMLSEQPYGILVVSADSKGEFANQTFCDFLQLKEKPEDLVGLSSEMIIGKVLPAYVEPETVLAMIKDVVDRFEPFHNYEIALRDGRVLLMDFEPLIVDSMNTGRMWIHRDITERKKAEEKIKVIHDSFISILDAYPGIIKITDPDTHEIILINKSYTDKLPHYDNSKKCYEAFYGFENPCSFCTNDIIKNNNKQPYMWEHYHESDKKHYLLTDQLIKWHDGRDVRMEIGVDISERKMAEDTIVLERNKLMATVQNTHIGFVICDSNGENISMNAAAFRFHGFASSDEMYKRLGDYGEEWELRYPDGRLMPIEEWPMSRAIHGDYVKNYEVHLLNVKNGITWIGNYTALPVLNSYDEETYIVMTIFDITEQKKSEDIIKDTMSKLERSNKELEQFAYVASHDLQEPLRMVSSYTQLLAKRYEDKLDGDAKEFIEYAVGGATRMQGLINDLLEYSRLNTRKKPYVLSNCNSLLGKVRINISVLINEENAVLTNDELPSVMADETQLMQLFQNLIINGIKYHNHAAPHVHISAKEEKNEWVFSFKDNGIGIDKEFHERIFGIFQRLHSRDEYSGTGIGLAICRRIVERHGGRIWLESAVGEGTIFYFSIPK